MSKIFYEKYETIVFSIHFDLKPEIEIIMLPGWIGSVSPGGSNDVICVCCGTDCPAICVPD